MVQVLNGKVAELEQVPLAPEMIQNDEFDEDLSDDNDEDEEEMFYSDLEENEFILPEDDVGETEYFAIAQTPDISLPSSIPTELRKRKRIEEDDDVHPFGDDLIIDENII
jgi:hypothetical protein